MYQLDETDESGNEFNVETTENRKNPSYWRVVYKSRKQALSAIGGYILLLISGLHIGWGIWRLFFYEPWMPGQPRPLFIFTKMSWYVAAIVGGAIGSGLVTVLRKHIIYYVCACILTISSIIYIIWYDEHIAIVVGRSIAGLGHGIVYLTTIIHVSENAAKEVRGMVVSLVNTMIFIGVAVSAVVLHTVTYHPGDSFSTDRILGIIGLTLSVASAVCTIFLDIESVAYLLVRNKEIEAKDCLRNLRDEPNETWRITDDIQEMHAMVQEDQKDGKNIFTEGNAKPLAYVSIFFVLGVLTNNYLTNIILFNFLAVPIGWSNFMLTAIILASVRAAMSIVSVFFCDIIGRKIHVTITGVTLFVTIIISIVIFFTSPHLWLFGSFAIIFQVFVAIGIDPIQHILLSEAFSTSKKPFSIAFVMAVENSLQILFFGMYFIGAISSSDIYLLVACCIFSICALVLILLLLLPETKGMSLKEARDEFRDENYSKHFFSGYDTFNCGCKHSR
ncbi:Solute carrier family 2, facilitated glucose transporter member 2 [Pseudolycoriella hygida]|uniref:Solute carrier family 2, facilitated glucose transporter member 2 n=1 Tax=Pseudolycoriella hygida TaxID=35572 RepID=A0A9Q0MQS5_9DIPT|nr:Solute carrier family 2, facilitated glucose transporter member 2 [Pseudolycoriella hygida]